MKPNQNQQNTNQQNNQPVSGPAAASKRDVQEAEKTAQSARQEAQEAQKMAAEQFEQLQQEVDRLQEENRELRKFVEKAMAGVRIIDEHLTHIEKTQGNIVKSYKTEEISENLGLPKYEEFETIEFEEGREEE